VGRTLWNKIFGESVVIAKKKFYLAWRIKDAVFLVAENTLTVA
tara:strand:- start:152 stop:280 length:129 start_codon:yes stop_codon:yes gene_type:complete